MKKHLLFTAYSLFLFASCSNEDTNVDSSLSTQNETVFSTSLNENIDLEKVFANDSVYETTFKIEVPNSKGSLRSVKEFTVSGQLVKTSITMQLGIKQGITAMIFNPIGTPIAADRYVLTIKVPYVYGQYAIGHKGTYTGWKNATINNQEIFQEESDNAASQIKTFSTSVYYIKTDLLGRQYSCSYKYYPVQPSQLRIYYTWIDGNN